MKLFELVCKFIFLLGNSYILDKGHACVKFKFLRTEPLLESRRFDILVIF